MQLQDAGEEDHSSCISSKCLVRVMTFFNSVYRRKVRRVCFSMSTHARERARNEPEGERKPSRIPPIKTQAIMMRGEGTSSQSKHLWSILLLMTNMPISFNLQESKLPVRSKESKK